ncbi:MAG: polysaccharide biosynthesis/export family protein [Vicinamibacterales bacterium]
MTMTSVRWCLGFGVVLASLAVCQAQTAVSYVIGPRDVLAITVFDQTTLSNKYTVETDGTFTFPLVGRVRAAGLTLRDFESELKRLLADGYFKDPQLSVAIDEYRSQRIFVVGEVRQPGTVALAGGMTLIEVLARAGSTLPTASGEVLVVRHQIDADGPRLPDTDLSEVIRVSLKDLEAGGRTQNVQLRDGDTIFVPQAAFVYVFGQVRNPGSYPIQRDTTVLQALSLAGGVTELGAMNRIKIVRIVDGQKQEIKVKPSDIVKGGDTVIVPERFF